MSNLFFDTMEHLTPSLRRGDLEMCEREIAKKIRALPPTPFHIVLDLSITNEPTDAARHFDRFLRAESARLPIAAAYTEMNGFDINPDLWYCDLFAYTCDGGDDDYDWLSDWQSEPFDDYTICGLEELQAVYASNAFRDESNDDASSMSSLMVVVKFQRFVRQAAHHMKQLRFPLYVTAHDFDFIAAMRPSV